MKVSPEALDIMVNGIGMVCVQAGVVEDPSRIRLSRGRALG